MSVTAILQKVPLFGQLSPAELERVAEITRERSYPRNSV
ncbi:MAG: Crp/Fnr family transcriptional regulator, partial [Gemmatimonadetes bacterium]